MFFKTIVGVLLLSSLGATEVKRLTITEVRWLWSDISTTLQICAREEIPAGQSLLTYDDGINGAVNADGVIDQEINCANFIIEGILRYSGNPSRYQFIVKDPSNAPPPLAQGITTITITVSTTPLTCGDSKLTKHTWSGDEVLPSDFKCLTYVGAAEKICYRDEDLTGTEFCFEVKDAEDRTVKVCLTGPTDIPAPFDGTVSVNYFYYGPEAADNLPGVPTLSLVLDPVPDTFAQMRAIVKLVEEVPALPGATPEASIYDCVNTECTFAAYTRKAATYEVCVDAMSAELVTVATAATTFNDLYLYTFDGGAQLLELVFANGLVSKKYTANLYQGPPPFTDPTLLLNTANMDCTGVQPGNACFGFVETTGGAGVVHLALSEKESGNNMIVAPFTIL